MKNNLFSKKTPKCTYCCYSHIEKDIHYCQKGKCIKNNKCKSFLYNPTLRIPNITRTKPTYTTEDFVI